MTSSDPQEPFRGTEYPPLENSQRWVDPNTPVDYPTDPGIPPPVYPPPPAAHPGAAGYPSAPGYYPGGGYDPYRPMRPPGTNGMAIAAMIVSASSIMLCCGIPSFVGVILGVLAMRETRRTGQDGHGLALAATIIGGLAVAGWLIYILLYVGLMASGWQWI
jgi:Domain of unknown function (DUF4190)